MKSTTIASIALALFGIANARPSVTRDVQEAYLSFQAGPVSYDLLVPTDGTVVETNSDLNINIITVPAGYDVYERCHFSYAGPAAENPPVLAYLDPEGDYSVQKLAVGPPSVITSVFCI